MSAMREIRVEQFDTFLSESVSDTYFDMNNIQLSPVNGRKRRHSGDNSTHSSKRMAIDGAAHSSDYPLERLKLSVSGSLKQTLRRRITLRRSIRVKKKPSDKRQSSNADYSMPFGNTFDYFRFVDLMTDLDKDHVLHKKIDHEMKMRDGSMKLLAAAKHTPQQLDAAKALHTSNCRMVAYMEHLQNRKSESLSSQTKLSGDNQLPCKAKVSVSELRIPLMWKDTDHFKNRGNYKRFTVFCIVRIGTEVYETAMVTEVDRSMTDITFDDVITLDNISHGFQCRLEVYAYEHHEDLTIASTQVKLKKKINDISNTVGRRLSGLTLKEPFDVQSLPGPRFELVAQTMLKLSDASEKVSSFDLNINSNLDMTHQLPLYGNFCCRFVVQPDCLVKETVSGFLLLKENDSWVKYWCSLQNLKISCWNSQFEADLKDPLTMIPITKESVISDTDPSHAERLYSFHITNRAHNNVIWYMAALSSESLALWWEGLQQHLLDQVVWKHSCERLMEIQEKKTPASPYFQRDRRAGSLYDKTRVKRVKNQLLNHHAKQQEGSPLTLAFQRFAKETADDKSPLSRNNSYPK